MATDFSTIRKWYSHKGLKALDAEVIPTLAQAEDQGSWTPHTSRKIRAALKKQSVAHKFGKANERKEDHRRQDTDQGMLDDIADIRGARQFEAKIRGWHLLFAMSFGLYDRAPTLQGLAEALRPFTYNEAEREALDQAAQWVRDFTPIATLVQRLDNARPTPTYVFATVSPTVFANVGKAMNIDFTSVCAPEILWHCHERLDPKTQRPVFTYVPEIRWPAGTKHGVSQYARGSRNGNAQCEACGHAIKSNNWVPLVADTASHPVSLWVGRDCAQTLFGAKITGNTVIPRDIERPHT